MGTTTDKLNRLISTKEGIRQEINRAYGVEKVSTSDTFNSYIQKLEEHPLYLLEYIERTIKSIKVSNVTAIGNGAFRGCDNLSNASFPNATSIGTEAFAYCDNLSNVSFPNATSIGSDAFRACPLSSVFFPNATSIDSGAFRACSFSNVSFPNVTYLGANSFRACEGLTIASFPKLEQIAGGSTGFIKSGVFYGCSNLTTLYIGTEISTVCALGVGAFQGCPNLANIYVPASLVDSYKSATNRISYASKIKAAP